MAWTGQTFAVGQILTAAQMTNLQNDITAAFAKDSGAPQLAANYIVDAMIASGVILESSLASAVAAQLVTNGDSHNHSGGDGAAIPNASVTGLGTIALLNSIAGANLNNNIVTMAKMYATIGTYGTVSLGTAGTFTTEGLHSFHSESEVADTDLLYQAYIDGSWTTLSNVPISGWLTVWIVSGSLRIYNTTGAFRTLAYQKFLG